MTAVLAQIGAQEPLAEGGEGGFIVGLAIGWADGLPGQRYSDDDRLGIVDLIESLLGGSALRDAARAAGFYEQRARDLFRAFVEGPVATSIARRNLPASEMVPLAEAIERCGLGAGGLRRAGGGAP